MFYQYKLSMASNICQVKVNVSEKSWLACTTVLGYKKRSLKFKSQIIFFLHFFPFWSFWGESEVWPKCVFKFILFKSCCNFVEREKTTPALLLLYLYFV